MQNPPIPSGLRTVRMALRGHVESRGSHRDFLDVHHTFAGGALCFHALLTLP